MTINKTKTYDIIIIGGGMVGLSQSLLLSRKGFSVLVLDFAPADQPYEKRTTAISYGSSKILEQCNVWKALEEKSCPIQTIDILENGSPVLLKLLLEDIYNEESGSAFGWVIENSHILSSLKNLVDQDKNITFLQGVKIDDLDIGEKQALVHTQCGKTYKAKLLIGADGRRSFTRQKIGIKNKQWNYNQKAIIAMISHSMPHENKAVEHFMSQGPFAVLPMESNENSINYSAIVWTVENKDYTASFEKEDILTAAIAERLPAFYGEIISIENIRTYPLTFNHAYNYVSNRFVLIGDAAHGLHPIAGQGLNIGLRDVENWHITCLA